MFSTKDRLWSRHRPLLLGTGVALLGVVVCFAAAHLVGQQLVVDAGRRGLRSVPLGAAVLATVAGGLAAYGLGRLSNRTARPRANFGLLAAVGLLLSALPPWQAAAGADTAVWLWAMHAVVAAGVLPPVAAGLPRRQALRPGRTTPPPTVTGVLAHQEEVG